MKNILKIFKYSNTRIAIALFAVVGLITVGYILAGIPWLLMLKLWGGVLVFMLIVFLLGIWVYRGE